MVAFKCFVISQHWLIARLDDEERNPSISTIFFEFGLGTILELESGINSMALILSYSINVHISDKIFMVSLTSYPQARFMSYFIPIFGTPSPNNSVLNHSCSSIRITLRLHEIRKRRCILRTNIASTLRIKLNWPASRQSAGIPIRLSKVSSPHLLTLSKKSVTYHTNSNR